MHTLWSLVLLAAGLSDALRLEVGVNVDKKGPLRFMRRDGPYSNGTVTLLDNSTTSTTIDSSSPIIFSTTSTVTSSSSSPSASPITSSMTSSTSASIGTGVFTNTSTSVISTKSASLTPPKLPSFTSLFTSYSTSVGLNVTTPAATCTGSVTYFGSVPPTIYVTVTEGFDVTVTASNVSVTETPTLVTPLPACSQTIMPAYESYNPLASTGASGTNGSKAPQAVTATSPFNVPPPGQPAPNSPALDTGSPNAPQEASSAVYSSVDYTSTVVVTKKTPVTVIAPPTTAPDVIFNFPTQTPTPLPGNGGGNNGGSSGNNGDNSGNGGTSSNGGGNNNGGSSGGGDSPAPNTPVAPAPNAFASINNVGSTGGSLVNTGTPTSVGLGNIIASIINSPFMTASPVTRLPAAAAPLTTAIGNVPVVVLPSNSVAIGSQTFAIPPLVPTTVQVSGVTLTLDPTQIIAPSATITLVQPQRQQVVTPTATITTTVGDLTLIVGPTAAIISGTTYRIGAGAPATTVVVDGTSVSIGAGGVGLPSTTVAPGGVTGTPFMIYTTEGLTFSVGGTIAVVGGTTYRIGSNAPDMTTTIGPDHVTVSFGAGGVGLARTTLAPGGSPFVIVTAEGLTFSIDGTEAIISGTTYRIGSNAPKVTTSVGSGHASVSFGPGGVGLQSTTILPTTSSSRSIQTAETGSRSTSAATATQSAATGSGASTKAYVPVFGLVAWTLLTVPVLWLLL